MRQIFRTYRFSLGIFAGLLFGIGGGYELSGYMQTPPLGIPALREQMTNYRLIDPLLACNSREATTGIYKELGDTLENAVKNAKDSGDATNVSIYFQEYPSGRWVGIDQDHQYNPASLLKIVLMIAYLKYDELHPGALEKKYTFTSSIAGITNGILFDSTSTLVVGKSYGTEALIRSMIIDSDNGAKDVLLENADDQVLAQVYKDLGIPNPDNLAASAQYTISPKAYSLFFRILYNATYLSREDSEKAMTYLTQATYADGLRAGVPENSTIAHKFGEHVNTDTAGNISSVELHDCGVIYGSHLPYFLCVMTSGPTVSGLEQTIKQVSATVFASVNTTGNTK